ncbi:MAG: Ldh family oxidoreductase [Candidatus Cloacimonas sp.]|jgi:LDH2 family malate/lactate/ureidoglycolate dehydrogenase|nr:Ldh family oxidoreductase [Candidatus Cloacimonadota bacterium]
MQKKLSVEVVYEFMIKVFKELGVPEDEAKICADVLITSDLSGIESHGIGRLKMYYDRIKAGIQSSTTNIEVVADKGATAVWDGNHGMGHVIGHRAMQKAIDKAKEFGLGSVAVRNSTHYGICGYYAKMAIKQGMIGITFSNARPSIAPLFGVTPLLGTNPICFGAPTDLDYPFLYDAATSITQRGKIEVLARENKETPEGWAIDSKGKTHTDTDKLLVDLTKGAASLLSIGGENETTGGHKGYGLATMVEILCAALQNGSYLSQLTGQDENGNPTPYSLGHFFMAINIEYFIDLNVFKKIVGNIIRQLKNSEKSDGYDHIYVAGEKEYDNELRVRREGVPITDKLMRNMIEMGYTQN